MFPTSNGMTDISIFVAFGAGVVSFLAPCVLPLVPGFIAYLGGVALEKNEPGALKSRFAMLHASIFFVLGFTTVFAVLGLILHGVLMQVGPELQTTLAHIGGVVIIFFGLYLMGLIKLVSLWSLPQGPCRKVRKPSVVWCILCP